MGLLSHPTFASAYHDGLRTVLERGEHVPPVIDRDSPGSRFGQEGRATRELRPFSFTVDDPQACLLKCSARQPDITFAFGQWLWMMRGADDVESISYYNPKGRDFSLGGIRLRGAFGNRMRVRWGDQVGAAIALLQRDPMTRRALIAIVDPADSRTRLRDHPCALAFQLFLRSGRLEAITSMRSQSALMVLPYDAALFMTLQVWIAAVLGVEPGPHTWIANSYHIHEDELQLAKRVLHAGVDSERLPPILDPERAVGELLRLEADIRIFVAESHLDRLKEASAEMDACDELHESIRALLLADAALRLGDPALARKIVRRLPNGWQALLTQGISDRKSAA